jgi:hypothetical protein
MGRWGTRNDNPCWRHCEPTGPTGGRPEDRLREAIPLQIIVQIAPFRIGPVDQVDLLLP